MSNGTIIVDVSSSSFDTPDTLFSKSYVARRRLANALRVKLLAGPTRLQGTPSGALVGAVLGQTVKTPCFGLGPYA